MNIPLSLYVPEHVVSRDGFSRPIPRQPAHLHTRAKSGAYSRDSSRFPRRHPFICLNRRTPSGQSRVYRVAQLRTDGVQCREFAGTGPVVLKVVPVTGAAILQVVTMGQLMCPLFSHTHNWYEVGILITGGVGTRLPLLSRHDGGHFATCGTTISCLYRAAVYPVGGLYGAFYEPCGCPVSRQLCTVSNFPVQILCKPCSRPSRALYTGHLTPRAARWCGMVHQQSVKVYIYTCTTGIFTVDPKFLF